MSPKNEKWMNTHLTLTEQHLTGEVEAVYLLWLLGGVVKIIGFYVL